MDGLGATSRSPVLSCLIPCYAGGINGLVKFEFFLLIFYRNVLVRKHIGIDL